MGPSVPLEVYWQLSVGVGIAGGGSYVSMYSVNWPCNFVMRVVATHSYVVSVAFLVDIVTTDWRLAVVVVARFASTWEWVFSICYWTDMFACLVAA